MHVRLSNVLDDYGDVKVPGSDRLVIGGCNEPPILVNEGNRVDGPEVLVVFLRDFAGVHVILHTDGQGNSVCDALLGHT